MVLTACKDKKPVDEKLIIADYDMPEPSASVVTMAAETVPQEVEWGEGRKYVVTVVRQPADSLPLLTDEIGQKYKDNLISVTVERADKSQFFHRTFSKSSFANWLDSDYQRHALLAGIRFLRIENDELVFTAWLNYPGATDDESVELRMRISRFGEVVIQRYSENDRDDLEQMEQKEGEE